MLVVRWWSLTVGRFAIENQQSLPTDGTFGPPTFPIKEYLARDKHTNDHETSGRSLEVISRDSLIGTNGLLT